jgi:hypothetical protein
MCYAALLSSSACYLRRVHISNNLLKQDADSSNEGLNREMPVNREELLPHLLSVTNDSHLLTRKAVSSVLSRGRRKRWNDIFKHTHILKKKLIKHEVEEEYRPRPQESSAHGGDLRMVAQSLLPNSRALYCVPTSQSYCCRRN